MGKRRLEGNGEEEGMVECNYDTMLRKLELESAACA